MINKFIIVLMFFVNFSAQAQSKKVVVYDSLKSKMISVNYRVFDASPGLEIKYFNLKDNSGFGFTSAVGFVRYDNSQSILNAQYKVNGYYGKVGGALYQKFSGAAIYLSPNLIFSQSNQSVTALFKDNIWGTYSQEYSISDFNIGLEAALGFIIKVHPKAFIQLEGSLGSKLLKQDNPIYKQMGIDEVDAYSLPYFTPGMGRGGLIFINASIGIGYNF